MKIKHRWIWEAYLIIILVFAMRNLYDLFSQDSKSFLYYFILRSFDPTFMLHFSAYILYVLLNIIHCIPLFLFIYRIRFGNPEVWKLLFVLRCFFEVIGHSYDMNALVALYHAKPKLLLPASVIMIIPHIPSYLACYWYAFRNSDPWLAFSSQKSLNISMTNHIVKAKFPE